MRVHASCDWIKSRTFKDAWEPCVIQGTTTSRFAVGRVRLKNTSAHDAYNSLHMCALQWQRRPVAPDQPSRAVHLSTVYTMYMHIRGEAVSSTMQFDSVNGNL